MRVGSEKPFFKSRGILISDMSMILPSADSCSEDGSGQGSRSITGLFFYRKLYLPGIVYSEGIETEDLWLIRISEPQLESRAFEGKKLLVGAVLIMTSVVLPTTMEARLLFDNKGSFTCRDLLLTCCWTSVRWPSDNILLILL